MGKKVEKILFGISFLIIILLAIFFKHFKNLVELKVFKKNYVLLIGILSAPENFEQRLSIRKTWLQLLPEISGISYFIIGNQLCHVPEIDRSDPYSCADEPFLVHENATSETEFSTMNLLDVPINKFKTNYLDFSFYTRSQILVTKLGILRDFLKVTDYEIRVKMISPQDGKVLASATFNKSMLEKKTTSALIKAINPVLLPKNFEAIVKLEGKNLKNILFPTCSSFAWMIEPRVITIINLWDLNSKIPHPFTKNSCTYIFMIYTIPDIEEVKTLINSRSTRLKTQEKLNSVTLNKLYNEKLIYKDILFVDVVDVYRNLSLKMVKFYERISETEYFQFVLKTDDDSFIDLIRVEQILKNILKKENQYDYINKLKNEIVDNVSLPLPSKFWWWSFFREFWKVQFSGKWRENQYKSASYPSFPCGGGYVLNEGIVKYIVSNSQNFNYFQGEDVSIGIWLSPLPVTYFTNPKLIFNNSNILQKKIVAKFKGEKFWNNLIQNSSKYSSRSDLCDWTCTNEINSELPFCNKVQNSVEGMYATWTNYINLGFC